MSTYYYAWIGYGIELPKNQPFGKLGYDAEGAEGELGKRFKLESDRHGNHFLVLSSSFRTGDRNMGTLFEGTIEVPAKEAERLVTAQKMLGLVPIKDTQGNDVYREQKWFLEVGFY